MQGYFQLNASQYPITPVHIGNDLVLKHQLNDTEYLREPVAGEYKSDERNAQNARFAAEANRLNNEARAKSAAAEHKRLAV